MGTTNQVIEATAMPPKVGMAIGTSAVRDAPNRDAVALLVARHAGLPLTVQRERVRAIPLEYRDVPSYIGYAIGVARHDEDLISFAWSAISSRHEEAQKLLGAVRDIERVVLFMKAATSENRTTPVIEMLLASRGVDVNS